MDEKEFDVSYWDDVWQHVKIPREIKKEHIHELHRVFVTYLPTGSLNLIEIGCAPGGWLAYFYNNFRYAVSGVEYAPLAHQKTLENLNVLQIKGDIFQEDFMKFAHAPYDVVFSGGFIEHFRHVQPIIEKIVALCRSNGGIVVTIIPSMEGVNRWISKTFRPHVAEGHFPMSKKELIAYHEESGLETLYCDYSGSLRILHPVEKNRFSKLYPRLSAVINLPFRIWNRAVNIVTKKTGLYPKCGFLTERLVYIGKKR